MTTTPAPSKAKSIVALVGGLLTVIIPLLTQISGFLPPPWPALIGGVIALLTVLGVYHAPYLPPGTTVQPAPQQPPPPPAGPSPGGYVNPWA